jgi:AcrR family transcriptional regulator
MPRKYTQKKRAEQQAETRHRITEAALELHKSLGPARTTFSMVAERAGVQRHTLYAHFPDERSLFMACSGLHQEQDPPPDAAPWLAIANRAARLGVGLGQIYAWYERNATLIAAVLRDSELNDVLRDVSGQRLGPYLAAWRAALLPEDGSPRTHALLDLALSFHTWRTLSDAKSASFAANLMASLLISKDAAD